MSLRAGVGLVARRWVRPPSGQGERRTFIVFLLLFAGLLSLLRGSQLVMTFR